jgi:integrase
MNSNHAISKIATAFDVHNAKPADKPFTLRCGDGLRLFVTPAGTKSWRCHYQRKGTDHVRVLGHYRQDKSGMSLAEARHQRALIRKAVKDGRDPAAECLAAKIKRAEGDAATFEKIAREWLPKRKASKRWSEAFAANVLFRLGKHVFPVIGKRPIADISFDEIHDVLTRVLKAAPAQTAHVRQHMAGVFDYAVGSLRIAPFNPVRSGANDLPKRHREDERHQPRAETIEGARAVLAAVETSQAGPVVKLGHRLIALTAVRKQEVFDARWAEFGPGLWTIPKGRMKAKRPHLVPLSPQAKEVIEAARALAKALGWQSDLVFPSAKTGRAQSRNTINDCMKRALVKAELTKNAHVPHGWRGTFSTLMNERYPLGDHYRIIEIMLAHKVHNSTAAPYNGAEHLPERRELFEEWADLLLDGAPDAFTIAGLQRTQAARNVVQLREQEAA